jgi:hypothetical protein
MIMVCAGVAVFSDKLTSWLSVLSSDYASLLAQELGWNPIISDEMGFDIIPAYVSLHARYVNAL